MSAQGERIRKLRLKLGLTQTDFAKKIGVKGGVVSAWEKGTAEIPFGRVLIICDAYGVNERWMRSGNGAVFIDSNRQKKPKDVARDYLLSLVEQAAPELRQTIVDFCWKVVERFNPNDEEDADEFEELGDEEEFEEEERSSSKTERRANFSKSRGANTNARQRRERNVLHKGRENVKSSDQPKRKNRRLKRNGL